MRVSDNGLVRLAVLAAAIAAPSALAGDTKPPPTGPQTEKRFPPLRVPAGFRATLFACDPLVEYPSVIAIGPRPNTVFVAHDYVTGLGVEIVRRDEIRLLEDTDADGYADRSTVFAGGFNSVQGLAYDGEAVYVMHAPLLTVLRDRDGDGVAEERRDLLNGLGIPPEENPNRLHCANGVTVGHDGWLYLSLGDRGCDVERPEGDRLVFREGGILRVRPDGRDLHVYSGGLRNIYDVALDAALNVFVRDNENDGGDYMIRVCRSFFGADHGYPYLYYEHPDEALRPLADLGRGSSAGGTAYLETAFPEEYRRSLFFCEWGRAVVRYECRPEGSGFAPMQEIEFASADPADPYGLKPTDLVVDRDGSLLISDWGDGQRPQRGRGRIYRVAWAGNPKSEAQNPKLDGDAIARLNSASYAVRFAAQRELERAGADGVVQVQRAWQAGALNANGRLHAVWILARGLGSKSIDELFGIAASDPEPAVRIQAVRALADLTEPMLAKHRLDAGRGDADIARRFAKLGEDASPPVYLEILSALGRLRWTDAPEWLAQNWRHSDSAIDHAAQQLLRRADNWPGALDLLDAPAADAGQASSLRQIALRALADRTDIQAVNGLIGRVTAEKGTPRRVEYADLLARVHKQPGPWEYWGFRPAPRPANSVAWERTEAIAASLNAALADADRTLRVSVLANMRREHVPVDFDALADWLRGEEDQSTAAMLIEALEDQPADDRRELLADIVRSRKDAAANRLAAWAGFVAAVNDEQEPKLAEVAQSLEAGPVLAAAIETLGQRKRLPVDEFLLAQLAVDDGDVRAAAVLALARRDHAAAGPRIAGLLDDDDLRVQRAAAEAAGTLRVREAGERLLAFSTSADVHLQQASLVSLAQLDISGAIAAAAKALAHPDTQLAGLGYLERFGGVEQLPAVRDVAARNRSAPTLRAVIRTLNDWPERTPHESQHVAAILAAIAEIQGDSGTLIRWQVVGPVSKSAAAQMRQESLQPGSAMSEPWPAVLTQEFDGAAALPHTKTAAADATWLAITDLQIDAERNVEFLGGSSGAWQVWLDGRSVFQRTTAAAFRPDADRFGAVLSPGTHRLLVELTDVSGAFKFQLNFRSRSSKAEHERLMQMALSTNGNATRGREVFLNAEKSLCVKCHRLGEQGPRIGPDLAGVGRRFARMHLLESILQPSRTVAPSYETLTIALTSGRVVTGVKVTEDAQSLTLGDHEGKQHTLSKADIEIRQPQSQSTMPEGLEKRLTEQEFLDLMAYLVSQTQ